jgi:TPR repeat protein
MSGPHRGAPILGTAPRGPWRLARDLYWAGGSFRGFLEFAVIGVVMMIYMATNPFSFASLATGLLQSGPAAIGASPQSDPAAPQSGLPPSAGTSQFNGQRALAPRLSDIGFQADYFANESEPLRGQLKAAAQAYRDRDYARAVRLLDNTDADNRATLLMRGLATIAIPGAQNFQSGFAMLERAIALGDPKAAALVGVMKISGLPGLNRDIDAGRSLLERAAASGDAEASRVIGEGYLSGWMGTIDLGRAATQFRAASERGDVKATRRLAEMHFTGTGMMKDHREAERLMEKAARADDTEAQALLGTWRLQPYISGVTDNPDDALQWLERAAAKGQPRAMEYLGMFYVEIGKRTGREDQPRGVRIFQSCAETKDPACLFAYGTALYFGYGTARDLVKAYGVISASNTLKPGPKAADRIAELTKLLTPEEIKQGRAISSEMLSRKPPGRNASLSVTR